MFVQHYALNHMPATKGIVNVTAGSMSLRDLNRQI